MVENRFPTSGLSSEYGDIVIDSVTAPVVVEIRYQGALILSEVYSPDADSKIYIREVGELAILLIDKSDFMTQNGYTGYESILLNISIIGTTTISKDVTIYQSIVDFLGSLDVTLLKQIPLSRSTNKSTGIGRTEWISFYGTGTLKAYVVRKGTTADLAATYNVVTYSLPEKIYNTNVSPSVIATLAGCTEADLIYYNIYVSTDSIIRFTMDERNYPDKKTFVFRNFFGAQETFTCTGSEKSERKWTRSFGNIDNKQVSISRDLVNKLTANTGYLSDEDLEVLEDMLNSDQICLLDEYGLQEVVILEENFNDTSRKDELKVIEFGYRFAKNNQSGSRYKKFIKPRIFSPEFDETFN